MNLILEKQALPGLLQGWREQYDVFLPQNSSVFSHFLPLTPDSVLVLMSRITRASHPKLCSCP
jgi:hypothetical protein